MIDRFVEILIEATARIEAPYFHLLWPDRKTVSIGNGYIATSCISSEIF